MIFKDCYPKTPVDQLVQVYRLRHFIVPPNMKISPKPYPARPEQCITFYIRGAEYCENASDNIIRYKPRIVITGQYTGLLHRYCDHGEFLMVQAVFYPGVLHRITGIPFHELQNGFVDLESVFPREGREVMEQLANASGYEAYINIIDGFMLKLSNQARMEQRPVDQVFMQILHLPGQHTIEWYAREACLSHKQFERKAYEYMGISPKLYARIARFVQSYDMRQKAPGLDWLTIAINCGYHDYQHLIRDYKAFANDRPNGLFAAEALSMERRLGLYQH